MKKLITTMAVMLVAATVVHADTIAAWDMSGNAGSAGTQVATTTGAGMTAGSFAVGPGLQTNAGWVDSVNSYADWQVSSSLEWALGGGQDYFSFSLTPGAGQTASYSNVYTRFVVNAGNTGTDINFALLSSQTGFTTNDVLGTFNAITGTATNFVPEVFTVDFDLSGEAALQGVATATEFRIYTWKNSGGNRIGIGKTWSGQTGDDLRVDGSVIPEPGTLGLLGFAAAGMLWFRKRFSM